MYFGNLISELKRISKEQEEKYELKEYNCSLSLRDLCIIQTAIFTFDQIENLFAEKIDKPYEKFIEKKRREENFILE